MVSIVMPAYNEAEIIAATVKEWQQEVVKKLPGAELIVVDDCSKDQTGAILASLADSLPGVIALSTPENSGHGRAVRFGLERASQEFVFQTDSDKQHLPGDFLKLWGMREGNDFVLGIREARADELFQKLIIGCMRVWRVWNWIIWGLWMRDANCPFKLMRRDSMMRVLARIPQKSFIPMVMVTLICRRIGFRASEAFVSHFPRSGGEQSLKGMWRWMNVSVKCLVQLVELRASIAKGPIASPITLSSPR